ncbi:flagellar basal body rod protein FlgB [Desulfallas thermosapovorans]|uniref:Flagellar basal body rod protein FlgB n=1 Tax=Desulfallas thermosapovorans DSM 6562 TaxID=1121431 RepID=A0A5S4ZTR9_9FIRM|nr:flagellar basal body rod protein FlgB [Desulfallas thermosapovorans]TYO95490.1 flagellar basal-body rod protein FlgB [Desulfallas thermosapovorans DSM 6562]
MEFFRDTISTILAKQMDACTLRQKVIANNVANVNTPGFKKSRVNFQQHLREALGSGSFAMRTTNVRHIAAGPSGLDNLVPEVVLEKSTAMKASGNNVDIDEEMVNLVSNTLLYRLATRVRSDRANTMSYVIKGR